jgi:hypothetical protein
MRSVYAYEKWISDKGTVEESEKVYEDISRDGDSILFSVNGSEEDTVVGNVSFRNGLFDLSRLVRSGKETLDIRGRPVETDVYRSDLCGGSHIAYVGPDGMVVRDVRRQLWSMGIICEERLTLVSHTAR